MQSIHIVHIVLVNNSVSCEQLYFLLLVQSILLVHSVSCSLCNLYISYSLCNYTYRTLAPCAIYTYRTREQLCCSLCNLYLLLVQSIHIVRTREQLCFLLLVQSIHIVFLAPCAIYTYRTREQLYFLLLVQSIHIVLVNNSVSCSLCNLYISYS